MPTVALLERGGRDDDDEAGGTTGCVDFAARREREAHESTKQAGFEGTKDGGKLGDT